jgi:uncharacterized membrane protein YeiH
MTPLILLDYLGVTLFAATGALVASRKQTDIIGFVFLAALTGIGGGTARDLILDVPVFWVEEPLYVLICAGTAVLVFFTAHLIESRYRWVLWLDAAALAAFAVFGADKGLAITGSPLVAVMMGTFTATLGGILRDVVAGEPSVLMRKDIYVTAALAGALVYVLAVGGDAPRPLAAILGFATAFGVRSGALAFGWQMPAYRSRPGRDPELSLRQGRAGQGDAGDGPPGD